MTERAESEARDSVVVAGPPGAEYGTVALAHDGTALVNWLGQLVLTREYGMLAELRRPGEPKPAHVRAGWFGGDGHRELFERVAFLFAVYHRGRAVPSYGYGSLGAAARRIGDGHGYGPANPGAERLVARLVASRRVPWRHLQHAVTRLRSLDKAPPSWAELIEDLVKWEDREARVSYRWSIDFYSPDNRRTGK
ncbi:type I-E CRISPR-associated protein Cse2/CasB [Streptomyces sp. NPDC047046]|uniref:type I-E CRISPR-associated protein Cse2/CasB n=1 Tax=Streptomyces sp. NPDC047046 TaxID=3155378 RepID=UPI0033F62988